MNELVIELGKQGTVAAVLGVLLWIHARHVSGLVQAVASMSESISRMAEAVTALKESIK